MRSMERPAGSKISFDAVTEGTDLGFESFSQLFSFYTTLIVSASWKVLVTERLKNPLIYKNDNTINNRLVLFMSVSNQPTHQKES
jgi:hypothetical protein